MTECDKSVTDFSIDVIKHLRCNHVNFTLFEHQAVFTCHEADQQNLDIRGISSKNLFLKDRKSRRFYLVVMPAACRLDIKKLSTILNDSLKFAGKEELQQILKLTPGAVSPFGLLNDAANKVKLILHTDIAESDFISFHPNINTQTLEFEQKEFKKCLLLFANDFAIIDF